MEYRRGAGADAGEKSFIGIDAGAGLQFFIDCSRSSRGGRKTPQKTRACEHLLTIGFGIEIIGVDLRPLVRIARTESDIAAARGPAGRDAGAEAGKRVG